MTQKAYEQNRNGRSRRHAPAEGSSAGKSAVSKKVGEQRREVFKKKVKETAAANSAERAAQKVTQAQALKQKESLFDKFINPKSEYEQEVYNRAKVAMAAYDVNDEAGQREIYRLLQGACSDINKHREAKENIQNTIGYVQPTLFSDVIQWGIDIASENNWFSDVIAQYDNLSYSDRAVAKNAPLEAYSVRHTDQIASKYTDWIFGKDATNFDGTLANAFKHAYWNALMTTKIGPVYARNISNAHEVDYIDRLDEPYLNSSMAIHTNMDLISNEIGIKIGAASKYGISDAELAAQVLEAVLENQEHVEITDYGNQIIFNWMDTVEQ